MAQSAGESLFSLHCRAEKLEFIPEYRFDPARRWRADFCFLAEKLLVEIEGGAWSGGRHTRGAGFVGDLEKYNRAAIMGFHVLRFTPDQVQSGAAIEMVKIFLIDYQMNAHPELIAPADEEQLDRIEKILENVKYENRLKKS